MSRRLSTERIARTLLPTIILPAYLSYLLQLFQVTINRSSPYYSLEEMLGPLSNVAVLICYVAMLCGLVTVVTLKPTTTSSIVALTSAITIKYLLPQALDLAYTQNFYDAGGHMMRGAYVVITGRSDPRVDTYFELQPGFFWWTAVYVNVVFGPQVSLSSMAFEFLMKWFNAIILILYLPIIMLLLRKLGLSTPMALLGYAVFILVSLSRHHYAAQNFSWAIYWLLLAIFTKVLTENSAPARFYVSFFAGLAPLVFVHQGTTFFTLISLLSFLSLSLTVTLFGTLSRGFSLGSSALKLVLYSAIFLMYAWFTYLAYATVYVFGDFVKTLNRVVELIVGEGIAGIATRALVRPYEPWHRIVIVKGVYMVFAIAMTASILLLRFLKRKDRLSITMTVYAASLSGTIGPIALALGGAGYVERVYEALAPLIAFAALAGGIDEGAARTVRGGRRPNILGRLASAVFCSALCSGGGVIYFAGWNFQSIAYSEWFASSCYLRSLLPSIADIYLDPDVCVQPTYYPVFPYKDVTARECLFIERLHNNIQAVYYSLGDPALIDRARMELQKELCLIYSSPTAIVYLKPFSHL